MEVEKTLGASHEILREERRTTGRFVAASAAIFLSILGLYQALARGTPEYAALFLPALIMFVYVFWILYASRNRKKNVSVEEEIVAAPATDEMPKRPNLARSYSVA